MNKVDSVQQVTSIAIVVWRKDHYYYKHLNFELLHSILSHLKIQNYFYHNLLLNRIFLIAYALMMPRKQLKNCVEHSFLQKGHSFLDYHF